MKRVFKKINDKPKEADKFIGFHVDRDIAEAFTLLALNQKVSKSSLLRTLIKKLVLTNRNSLITGIAKQAFLLWKVNVLEEGKSLFFFKKDLVADLKSKRVGRETILIVLNSFDALV